MNFTFARNIHFTKLLKTNDRLREFNFRMIPNDPNGLFHVDVPDDRGNRIQFKMHKENNRWVVIDQQLPPWIWENEKRLAELIAEEVK